MPPPSLNVTPGTIFYMDNLAALSGINSSIIDLIRRSTRAATARLSAANTLTNGRQALVSPSGSQRGSLYP